MTDDMQRARELLAAEYERDGLKATAATIRSDIPGPPSMHQITALRAIAAALRAAPEGFVLVPVQLTDRMHDAGLFAPLGENSSDFVCASWAAMLAARPQGVK